MLQQYLDLFRTAHITSVIRADDKKTPAMRLGLAEQPLRYDDVSVARDKSRRHRRLKRRQSVSEDLVSRWDSENNTVTANQDKHLPTPGF